MPSMLMNGKRKDSEAGKAKMEENCYLLAVWCSG